MERGSTEGSPFIINMYHFSLLLRAEEIRRLIGKVEQRGYTLVPLNLHYSKGRIKLEVGLGRGKLKHDKRAVEREREWNREKQRLLRSR